MKSHYETLEVSPLASQRVIRAAYRCIAQQAHPDKNPHCADAVKTMSDINHAYEVLSDGGKRQQYDLSLGIQAHFLERRGLGPSVSDPRAAPAQAQSMARPFAFRPLG